MTLGRAHRLRELGLWPIWRLRTRADVAAPAPDAPAAEPAPAPASPPAPCAADAAAWPDWGALEQAIRTCTRCALYQGRTQGVVGAGDRQAHWLLVGEAPGADEDRQGEAFVGPAGRLLDAMLAAIDLDRTRGVYIANVLKSRPPGNRDPRPDEVSACLPYLERQFDLIQPRIVLALGRIAAQSLLLSDASISHLRGRVHSYRGVPLVVTYHPAYLLRNPADKAKVWEDLLLARATLQAAGRP